VLGTLAKSRTTGSLAPAAVGTLARVAPLDPGGRVNVLEVVLVTTGGPPGACRMVYHQLVYLNTRQNNSPLHVLHGSIVHLLDRWGQ
jgi:hypothetical protein